MAEQEQDKLWNNLSEEQKKEYRKEFQQESESYHKNVKHCDRENVFEYHTGYSHGIITTLAELFGEHNLHSMTYEDVKKGLFGNEAKYITSKDCCTKEMTAKIKAIIMVLNTAKFLNKNEDGSDWVPDWNNANEAKYFPLIGANNELRSGFTEVVTRSLVYFRSHELFEKAVQILGEDIFRTALTTNY